LVRQLRPAGFNPCGCGRLMLGTSHHLIALSLPLRVLIRFGLSLNTLELIGIIPGPTDLGITRLVMFGTDE